MRNRDLARLRHLRTLDPVTDHEEIYRTVVQYEFGWETLLGLNLAFYRTFGIPAIAELLYSTGEMTERTRKRADDTGLLMYELITHGLESERGRVGVRRLSQIHRRFDIRAEDYRYVLATFVVVPTRWIEQTGWRPMCCHERTATVEFYRRLGALMHVTDIPADYAGFERLLDAYEAEHFAPTAAAEALMTATRGLFAGRLPDRLKGLAGPVADTLLTPALRKAVGAPTPALPVRILVSALIRVRATAAAWKAPRTEPYLTLGTAQSYPNGYRMEELGPQSSE
ncbi:oxygenase MpaB family protein [Catenulispora pinisilvae]|uniref:oxygenase MpaB family protein n=1 Tax=Catenulispora pinisilvae TaxID=2705253 RepID=UPI001891AB23|nr:oxygenase MpaB family protein [Catenulispora pinisilvae]